MTHPWPCALVLAGCISSTSEHRTLAYVGEAAFAAAGLALRATTAPQRSCDGLDMSVPAFVPFATSEFGRCVGDNRVRGIELATGTAMVATAVLGAAINTLFALRDEHARVGHSVVHPLR